MPEITVLVPSHDHSQFVERTLRSIFRQTHPIKKLIVIDDGSKDESPNVIERVLQDNPFPFELIARENRGLCATLNQGLDMADTEYFAYLGSDDIWLPDLVEQQTDLLASRPECSLAFSHAYIIDEEDNIFDRTDNWAEFADGDPMPYLLRGIVFSSPGVVYRTSALKKHRWNEDAVLEDYELYLKLGLESEFARNTRLLCAWRQHAFNTSDDAPRMISEQIAAQERLFEQLDLSREELDKFQEKLRFCAVANYVRNGYRKEALPLLFNNLSGASSTLDIAGSLLRLATPRWLFDLNRGRKRKAAVRKYGKLVPESMGVGK